MHRLWLLLSCAAFAGPHLSRIVPLGGQAGTTVEVELAGKELDSFERVTFEANQIEWVETLSATAESVKGRVRIGKSAALGPYRFRAITSKGPSNSRLFNVHEFPGVMEQEPRQTVELRPQTIHGYMKGLADQDFFQFQARAGERWLFDVQSIERGGFLECSLTLTDPSGREIAFNEDQDEFLETPRLSFQFPGDGMYTLKVDQYRGPQGVGCGENCGYQLVMSQLPIVSGAFPLGARPGSTYKVRVHGESLGETTGAYLLRARGAEHFRLTFPFTMPVDGADGAPARIEGRVVAAASVSADLEFSIPSGAKEGLWRLWLVTRAGTVDTMSIEIHSGENVFDGVLDRVKENSYNVSLSAGKPFHAWTLAAQLGLPAIDTVLELWSARGKLLAEHDDLMTGQGTVIGNPDSSLYFLPKESGAARLVVRDRTNRIGPSFAYRLHLNSAEPGFQLLAEPEELAIRAGQEGFLEALLIKEPGFEKAVDVWIEGLPGAKAQFRADQHFGPSGDGDNINIPIVRLPVAIPKDAQPGPFPIRLRAQAEGRTGPIVEGLATLWIGPNGKRNDTRRPLPAPSVYVIP